MKIAVEMEKPTENGDTVETMDMVGMYGQSATIHGVSKVAAPQIYKFRRTLWIIMLLGMAVGLSIVVTLEFQRYNEHPTVTMVNAEFHDELRFPAVTICNINQYHMGRLPQDKKLYTLLYNLSEFAQLRGYLDNIDTDKHTNNDDTMYTGEYLYSVAMDAAHRLEELFMICTWAGRLVACGDIFERVVTDVGVCFRFNSNISSPVISSNTGPLSGLRVILDIQQNQSFFSASSQSGIQVLLNEPDEAPILQNRGLFVRPGTSTAIGIRKEELIGLTKPYKAFGTSFCYDTEIEDFKTPIKRYANFTYSRNTCRKQCFLDHLSKQCQCRHFFSPGDDEYCSLCQLNDCYIDARKEDKLHDIIEKCNVCPSKCHTVGYVPNMSSADFASTFIINFMVHANMLQDKDYLRNNVVDLRIFYDSLTVTKTEQKPELTVQGIMADLGGLMGMFLGASLLSLTELIEFLALLTLGFLRKRGQPKEPTLKDEKPDENKL